jgi:hypothetical protein
MMTHLTRPLHVTLADHFADPRASRHPLRLRLASGEELDCHAPVFDVDQLVLVVTTSDGVARTIRPEEVRALSERRARWPVYAGFTVATVAMGAGISALLVPLLSPLTAVYGALFGALGGGVAAAVVPSVLASVIPVGYARLLERLGPLAYWRSVVPKPDA